MRQALLYQLLYRSSPVLAATSHHNIQVSHGLLLPAGDVALSVVRTKFSTYCKLVRDRHSLFGHAQLTQSSHTQLLIY